MVTSRKFLMLANNDETVVSGHSQVAVTSNRLHLVSVYCDDCIATNAFDLVACDVRGPFFPNLGLLGLTDL